MSKAIICQAVLEGIRSKKDRSLGLTVSTPELTAQEKAIFMEMQGLAVELKITPLDTEEAPEYKVDKDLDIKSQSKRIRSVLFLIWKQDNEGMEFEQYYHAKTEKYLDFLKEKLDE